MNNITKFDEILAFIKKLYPGLEMVPLHAPVFRGNEKKYLIECIDSTYVSYVGKYVSQFEDEIRKYTGSKYAIAVVNGTCALEIALKLAGVKDGDEVLTQALTFIASVNAISYCKASPVFIDSDLETLGMSVDKLHNFLLNFTEIKSDGFCYNKITGKRIAACLPVHIFGHPLKIDEILSLCNNYHIPVVEDAAESIGSKYKNRHTGTFGKFGVLSFNGNKTITTGGGGMILTDDEALAIKAKHLTTTAKVPHKWEFIHDEIGYNYRMTNVCAAIGCAQMEQIESFINSKRDLAKIYSEYFKTTAIPFYMEKNDCYSNYWLNVIFLQDREERDMFLKFSNENGVMTRPAWHLINKLEMYKNCFSDNLDNANWLEDRIVNIPSSVR